MPEDVAFLDLEIQEHAGSATAGLVVFQEPEMELYLRLVEAARNRLTDRELEFGIEKSKVDAIRRVRSANFSPQPMKLAD